MRVSKGRRICRLDDSKHKFYLECPPWGGRIQRKQNRTNREREDEWSLSELGSAEHFQGKGYQPEVNSLVEMMGRTVGGSGSN